MNLLEVVTSPSIYHICYPEVASIVCSVLILLEPSSTDSPALPTTLVRELTGFYLFESTLDHALKLGILYS